MSIYDVSLVFLTMALSFVVWNTQRKEFYTEVAELSDLYKADFVVLIENTGIASKMISSLENKRGVRFYYHPNLLKFKNGHLYTTFKRTAVKPIGEHPRYTIKEITTPNLVFNLVIVHLPSKNNWGNSYDHDSICSILKTDIDFLEKKNNHKRTIVVGDFNMNPFETGMVGANGLHSVMDRNIAANKKRTIYGIDYEFFYNPMWSFLGDFGKGNLNGTNYYNSGLYLNYYWNMYDQVLIRPDMLKYFNDNELYIVETINGVNLTKIVRNTNRINTDISDHLPITFKLNI